LSTVIDGSAGITTNAGGSVNPSTNIDGINYSCRAWAKWSGVTTVTVNGSANISSITRASTGTYTVNFTTAISDANYSIGSSIGTGDNNNPYMMNITASPTTSAFSLTVNRAGLTGLYDSSLICISVFR